MTPIEPRASAPHPPRASAHWLDGTGALRGQVDGLLALCIEASSAPPAGVLLPYDGFMLSIRLPQPGSPDSHFLDSWLWPLRSRPDRYQIRGDGGTNLFAMLRPSAAMALMQEHRFGELPHRCAALATFVGLGAATRLETAVMAERDVDAKLRALAAWLEGQTTRRAAVPDGSTVRDLAGATDALNAWPSMPVAEVAGRLGVHRRRLEREFDRWLGASPKQVQMAARLQRIARLAWQGASPSAIAERVGMADPPHLAHSVRELTGMTFTRFTRSPSWPPLAHGFRAATAGAHLFG